MQGKVPCSSSTDKIPPRVSDWQHLTGTEQVQALLVTSRTAAAPLAAGPAPELHLTDAEAAAPRRRARLRDGTQITLAAARAATPAAGAADLHARR